MQDNYIKVRSLINYNKLQYFEVAASEVTDQHPGIISAWYSVVLVLLKEMYNSLGDQTASDQGQNHFILN